MNMNENRWNIKLKSIFKNGVTDFDLKSDEEPYKDKEKKRNPYLFYYSEKKKFIINPNKIILTLSLACDLLFNMSSKSKNILFVGIGHEDLEELVIEFSEKTNSHYVVKKWLSGFLTNWSTTESNLYKLQNWNCDIDMKINHYSKKIQNKKIKKFKRFERNLKGVKSMKCTPNIAILIIDNANNSCINKIIKECSDLSIYTICCANARYYLYSDLADIFVPINTESELSVLFVLKKFFNAIDMGKKKNII
uniref:ribosomal protein S2 n=1 Tax=Hydnora esculenta TaxID=1851369 RepID=UPI002113B6D8|nr:ribosomal protein S2 [Hydnora esculenta]USN93635.1 ribosomal protein S2 [Hydnora esculenta]